MRYVSLIPLIVTLLVPIPADAASRGAVALPETVGLFRPNHARDPFAHLFAAADDPGSRRPAEGGVLSQTPAPVPAPTEYSEGYKTRLKIHRVASFATLPLFATELWLGQSIYDHPDGTKKDAHVAVGISIATLFAVNTVTGVWNLWESRKDPNGRGRRIAHSVLMLAADAGFTATAAMAPESEHGEVSDDRAAHRAMAITSIAIGTAGYLLMLFTR